MKVRKIMKTDIVAYAAQFVLVTILVIIVLLMISSIENIQGNSRVVNYAGIIRGSTQRLTKLEISKNPDDGLIINIDTILDNLQSGSGNYDLNKLMDDAYLQKLDQLAAAWVNLKQEIYRFRINETSQSELISLSEDFFILANDTVSAAETYSEGEARQLKLLETALITIILLILLIIAKQIVSVFLLNRKNKELNKMAYIDVNTGLPNKSRCEQVIHDNRHEPGKQYACIMFDLNNLKLTNDQFGHRAGDELIYSFAGILLSIASENVFVGRYGGDEFIAVLFDTTEEEVKSLLQNIDVKINYFSKNRAITPISCAYGYEISTAHDNFSLHALLIKADEKMYKHKAFMKSKPICT